MAFPLRGGMVMKRVKLDRGEKFDIENEKLGKHSPACVTMAVGLFAAEYSLEKFRLGVVWRPAGCSRIITSRDRRKKCLA